MSSCFLVTDNFLVAGLASSGTVCATGESAAAGVGVTDVRFFDDNFFDGGLLASEGSSKMVAGAWLTVGDDGAVLAGESAAEPGVSEVLFLMDNFLAGGLLTFDGSSKMVAGAVLAVGDDGAVLAGESAAELGVNDAFFLIESRLLTGSSAGFGSSIVGVSGFFTEIRFFGLGSSVACFFSGS